MKLSSAQLPQHCSQPLKPIYLLSSSEPLLVQEAREQLIQAAQKQGYTETELLCVEPHFDWQQIPASTANFSLFAQKKLIDCRLPHAKPGDAGTAALQAYCKMANPDCVLIISTDKVDATSQKSRWYKLIDEHGAVLSLWPLKANEFPRWLQQRLSQRGLQCPPKAIALLAERTEGNLLAASQEIEKLQLLYDRGPLTLEQVEDSVIQASRYDIFQLIDTALSGDAKKCYQILDQLRAEGNEPPLILWALTRELRTITQLAYGVAQGRKLSNLLQEHRIWDTRKAVLQQALRHLSLRRCHELLQHAQHTDSVIKGVNTGNVWDELLKLALSLAGIPLCRPAA
jgi:DNA polymerase III subunit delta